MKKYLLGLFAVALALGLSSFTLKKDYTSSNPDDVYYFYIVSYAGSSTGVIPSGSSVQFGGTQTVSYANDNDGCTGTAKDCLRGFTTQPSLPTSASGQAQTLKN